MADAIPAELATLVAASAAAIDARRADVDGGVGYSIGRTVIVVVDGATAEFRLRADVAAAAARTPDAGASPRGPEWVAFTPTTFDRFARDRIASWIEFAAKQALDAPSGR